jgi:hypothetical protein
VYFYSTRVLQCVPRHINIMRTRVFEVLVCGIPWICMHVLNLVCILECTHTRVHHDSRFAIRIVPRPDDCILREGPCSQGASWAVCGSGVPPYDFLNFNGVFNSRFSTSFPQKRLDLKSFKGRTKAEEEGPRGPSSSAFVLLFKRGSVPPRCPLGSAVLVQFFLRNGSN